MTSINRIIKNQISNSIFFFCQFNKTKLLNKNSYRILMYHAIEESDLSTDKMGLAVPPSIFYMHMEFLKKKGFHIIDLLDLVHNVEENLSIPKKSIVITFDDGFRSTLNNALPILKEFSFPATLFVNIYFLERRLPRNLYCSDWQTLTWQEVRQLYESGLSIGSHGLTHNRLIEVDNHTLINEITKSKEIIEKNLGTKIYMFSYPHGAFNEETKKVLKNNNFHCACSSIEGVNDFQTDIFALRRTEINAFDNSSLKFEKKILGCYDWLIMTRKTND